MENREITNELKVWRARRNATQEELANAIDVSRQTINAIERGRFVPSVLTALKIAAFFDAQVEEIFFLRTESAHEKTGQL